MVFCGLGQPSTNVRAHTHTHTHTHTYTHTHTHTQYTLNTTQRETKLFYTDHTLGIGMSTMSGVMHVHKWFTIFARGVHEFFNLSVASFHIW